MYDDVSTLATNARRARGSASNWEGEGDEEEEGAEGEDVEGEGGEAVDVEGTEEEEAVSELDAVSVVVSLDVLGLGRSDGVVVVGFGVGLEEAALCGLVVVESEAG